ncbi:hypothetical protein AgCh_012695 [Apium graveolens]
MLRTSINLEDSLSQAHLRDIRKEASVFSWGLWYLETCAHASDSAIYADDLPYKVSRSVLRFIFNPPSVNLIVSSLGIYYDDSEDENDKEGTSRRIQNLPLDNTQNAASVESLNSASVERSNAASVERQSASSVEVHNEASVDHSLSTDNQVTSSVDRTPNSFQRINNSGGVSTNQHSISYHDNTEATSSRANLPPQRKWTKDHPFELIIGDATSKVQTRRATQDECLYSSFLSQEEPKRVEEALLDPD